MKAKKKNLIDTFIDTKFNNTRCMNSQCSYSQYQGMSLPKLSNCHTISKSSIRSSCKNNIDDLYIRINDYYKKNDDIMNYFRRLNLDKDTTFRGFCNDCDTKLFKPIDEFKGVVTPEICLKQHYRMICYGIHWFKERLEENTLFYRSKFESKNGEKFSTEFENFYEEIKSGDRERSLNDILNEYIERKTICEEIIVKKDYKRANGMSLPIEKNYPLVAGRGRIFIDTDIWIYSPYITYGTLHDGSSTFLLFSWIDKDEKYLHHLERFLEEKERTERIMDLMFRHSDFCIVPNSFIDQYRDYIKKVIESGKII